MESYTLICPKEPPVVLEAAAVQKLLAGDNGDCALLYLAMVQSGGAELHTLMGQLRWSESRCEAAAAALASMGLLAGGIGEQEEQKAVIEPPQRDVHTEYTRADLARALEGAEFAQLTAAVEEKLGKKLSHPDLCRLLGLYDDRGMPADVIFLLVGFCVERSAEKYGAGRRPTMRQIEQEGYTWVRKELMDLERADAYIQKYQRDREVVPRIMALLGLGDRKPSSSEEKYILSWNEMGFAPEVIEKAYDKTILSCKELKWPYMNKILRNWNEKGYHTLAEVEEENRKKAWTPEQQHEEAVQEDIARMDKYLEKLRMENSREGE